MIGRDVHYEHEVFNLYYPDNTSMPHFFNCYVGVTYIGNEKKRWNDHKARRKCRKPSVVSDHIKEYELTFDHSFRIIKRGSKKACYLLEKKLRPEPNMFLNVREGGIHR